MTLDELDKIIVAFIRERVAQLGELEGGLYGYYAKAVQTDTALRSYDRDIVRFLAPRLKPADVYIEIGTGIGQLAVSLALQGCHVIAVEQDIRRYNAAQALREYIRSRSPETASRVEFVHAQFPSKFDRAIDSRTTLIFTNLIFVKPEEAQFAKLDVEQQMLEATQTAGAIVIDLMRFTRHRDSIEQRSTLSQRIRSLGFREPIPITSPGARDLESIKSKSACVVYYEPSRQDLVDTIS